MLKYYDIIIVGAGPAFASTFANATVDKNATAGAMFFTINNDLK